MAPESATAVLGTRGYSRPVDWISPTDAAALGNYLATLHRGECREIIRNPHTTALWAHAAVNAPAVTALVRSWLGTDVAVENSFLVIKWPGTDFTVPIHQDGIDDDIELDPAQSVSCWVAISDADEASGCLEV
ncbi:phytanoyl-CoA dioxygenase family protein, partial [Nocardia gipuzkoensis]